MEPLENLGRWADALEPALQGKTDAGFVCVIAWHGGWAIGVSGDEESALASARSNALKVRVEGI